MTFQETQRFRQTWLLLVVIIPTLVPVLIIGFGLYRQLVLGKPFGNHPASDKELILISAIVLLLVVGSLVLFLSATLHTFIDKEGISYKFVPFQFRYKKILWKDIEMAEVVKYNPIGDYGGWGLRFGRKGKAYNVSGDRGLSIRLKSGKNFLVGTNKEDELRKFLDVTQFWRTFAEN